MSNAFNNFIAVTIQYYADFLLQFISVAAKVALSRGVSKHTTYISAEFQSVRAPEIPLEIARGGC